MKGVKWDLTRGEFEVLFNLLGNMLAGEWDKSIYDQILKALITKLYIKFYAKNLLQKSRYKLTIEPEVALAWLEMTKDNHLPWDSYEGTVVNRINALIDKQAAHLPTINSSIKPLLKW